MLKIKLARFGKRKQPHYRIIVNEARTKRDGKYVALLGHYAPTQSPKTLVIDMDEYNAWVKKGAQPTDTVASLAKRYASGNPFPAKKPKLSKKAKAKLEAEAESKAEAKEEAAKPEEKAPEAAVAEEKSTEKTPEKAPVKEEETKEKK